MATKSQSAGIAPVPPSTGTGGTAKKSVGLDRPVSFSSVRLLHCARLCLACRQLWGAAVDDGRQFYAWLLLRHSCVRLGKRERDRAVGEHLQCCKEAAQ